VLPTLVSVHFMPTPHYYLNAFMASTLLAHVAHRLQNVTGKQCTIMQLLLYWHL
jgi:hypothetical protein